MVQEFQVLRCYSCQAFQVHQVKKSKKWSCKLCGEKQSLLKVYGQGSGADCRHHVQKLNLLQGQVEQAEAGAKGESCENVISDDDNGDKTKQSILDSQEGATVSRWNKYMKENDDDACEEESVISTDREHYYSHQDCSPRSVRKRKLVPYYGGDFYEEDIEENILKNKIYKDGNVSEPSPVSFQRHEKPVSHCSSLQPGSSTLFPMNTSGHSTCSTASFLKRDPNPDTISNNFEHIKKIGPEYSVTSRQDVLHNDNPNTADTLCAHNRYSPGPQQSGNQPLPLISLQKHFIQSDLFQTGDDFDDNY
ncbi:hypothetical protein GDO81_010896 [Engystomops pustulosus]|uniref:MRN complex-interacting protein N-terminal domain-containing protein n=1 Tax=Engystomops pustulosus TaxID=76066 RepID=A0AAV7C4L0_ENGPU|nr:hypothetical protein GDO81_010896 [Engystomops pustulosus]